LQHQFWLPFALIKPPMVSSMQEYLELSENDWLLWQCQLQSHFALVGFMPSHYSITSTKEMHLTANWLTIKPVMSISLILWIEVSYAASHLKFYMAVANWHMYLRYSTYDWLIIRCHAPKVLSEYYILYI
jgi:hypothetical protein